MYTIYVSMSFIGGGGRRVKYVQFLPKFWRERKKEERSEMILSKVKFKFPMSVFFGKRIYLFQIKVRGNI